MLASELRPRCFLPLPRLCYLALLVHLCVFKPASDILYAASRCDCGILLYPARLRPALPSIGWSLACNASVFAHEETLRFHNRA